MPWEGAREADDGSGGSGGGGVEVPVEAEAGGGGSGGGGGGGSGSGGDGGVEAGESEPVEVKFIMRSEVMFHYVVDDDTLADGSHQGCAAAAGGS